MKTQESTRKRFRLTIGTKLVSLLAVLLISSVVSLVWLSTRMFIEDNTALIQQMNADTAASLAKQMRQVFESLTGRMRVLGTLLLQDTADKDLKEHLVKEFFAKDKDLLGILVLKHDAGAAAVAARAVSQELSSTGDADAEKALAALQQEKSYSAAAIANGEVQIVPFKLPDGSPAIAVGIPFIERDAAAAPNPAASAGNGAAAPAAGAPNPAAAAPAPASKFSHTLVAFVRPTNFVNSFADSDIVTSFMVDSHGRLLAHTDAARVANGENVSNVEIVKQLLGGKFNNGQTRYVDPLTNEPKLGAFRVVGFAGMGVVAEVAEAKAFEAAQRVQYRSMLIAAIILGFSFLIGYLYSGTITWPIKELARAAQAIAAGDFTIRLKPKANDEVADLSLTFNDMAVGLEERDRVKATFNKFHNKEIAEKLLSGEVKLGGERKQATIFFSDVRGFTAMSETMEPEQVVEMLNEYMTRMVSIVRKHHGIVDKYVGDAIMALWGVPIGHGDEDTYNALRACLEMRMELAELNKLRLSRGQNELKIGMGLNCGPVIAGNIGSDEKMEYTVIGDSVNTASRMESMTKEYGTDLLIPAAIRDKVKDRFVFEQAKSAKVKGKTQAIEVFKVKGYIDENGKEVLLETAYSSYASEKSDKAVHDEPAEGHEAA